MYRECQIEEIDHDDDDIERASDGNFSKNSEHELFRTFANFFLGLSRTVSELWTKYSSNFTTKIRRTQTGPRWRSHRSVRSS